GKPGAPGVRQTEMSGHKHARAGGAGPRARGRLRGWAVGLGGILVLCALRPAGSQPPGRGASVGSEENSFTLRDARLANTPPTRYWQIFVPREGALASA